MNTTINDQVKAEFAEQWKLATNDMSPTEYNVVKEYLTTDYVLQLFQQHEQGPARMSIKAIAYEMAEAYAIGNRLIDPIGWGE